MITPTDSAHKRHTDGLEARSLNELRETIGLIIRRLRVQAAIRVNGSLAVTRRVLQGFRVG